MTTRAAPEAPVLIGFEVDDVDNADAVFGVGDRYILTFDKDTDRASCVPSCEGGAELVNSLFMFSSPLASSYTARWLDERIADTA